MDRERTRALDGAHLEYFRGILNPIAVKLGPTAEPEEVLALSEILNPRNEPGRLMLIPRLGAGCVAESLPHSSAAAKRRASGSGVVTRCMETPSRSTCLLGRPKDPADATHLLRA